MRKLQAQPTRPGDRQAGVTLIELIAFIVIIGIIATALVSIFGAGVRGAPEAKNITKAKQLAQSRMELILARKRVVGFACFTDVGVNDKRFDPCSDAPASGSCPVETASTQPACAPPTGFTITTILDSATCNGGDTNYKCVTVTVTGPNGSQLTELKTWVVDY